MSAEKARCLPSGEGSGSWINRAFTGPSSTRIGKLSREPTGSETCAENGITVSAPVCASRRWILPP